MTSSGLDPSGSFYLEPLTHSGQSHLRTPEPNLYRRTLSLPLLNDIKARTRAPIVTYHRTDHLTEHVRVPGGTQIRIRCHHPPVSLEPDLGHVQRNVSGLPEVGVDRCAVPSVPRRRQGSGTD